MITYDTHVKPFSKSFQVVEIDDATLLKIDEFVRRLIVEKKKENHHKYDNRSHYKRYFTGTLGEVALEKFLNVSGIVDWNVGNSKDYHQPDLRQFQINAGVKTVEYGLFPIIFKKNYSNEIIMIKWKQRHVYICGLATKNVLNEYQSIELIKDEKLRARGTKTGFYGFEHIQKFANLEELIRLTNK